MSDAQSPGADSLPRSSQPVEPEGGAGLRVAFRLRRGRFTLDAALGAPAGVTALLGPSGAGKSLTLQAIAGLAAIESGRVSLNGRALADSRAGIALPPRLRRVGYVPQSYALFPHLSVAGNIAYGLPPGLDRAGREKRVGDLLALGRLSGYEGRRPRDLSGGEAQRVAVLRALAAEPEALLLDEPFSALDAPTRAAVRDDLGALIAASGQAPALLVTHDLAEARALAGRLALLVDGRVVVEGPIAEALGAPPTLRAARLLGWATMLPVAAHETADGATLVTLACGQRLALDGSAAAAETAGLAGASVALALRPERLLIERVGDEDDERDGAAPPDALRGVIGALSETGGALAARVSLDGAGPDGEPLELALSPREWASLGLAAGCRVRLRPLPGALRLVAREEAV